MNDFTKEPDQKELSFFVIPLICSGVFQQVYSLVNTAVVSRYMNYEAVAVIGACSGYCSMQNYIFVGMTTGFGFYIYRCIGTKDSERFRQSFWGAFFLNVFLSFAGLILPLMSPIFIRMADIPPELYPDAKKYLCFLFVGSGFLGLNNLLYCTIQGLGDSRFPGFLSMAGVITHTVLAVFLIAALKLGVYASALSVMLNNLFLTACLLLYLLVHERTLFREITFSKIPAAVWRELIKNGIVKSGMMILIGIGALYMQKAVNGLSVGMIAANSYASTLTSMFMQPLCAYATAAGIITGQNEGCRNLKNIRKYNRYLFQRGFLWCVFFMVLHLSAAPHMVRILSGQGVSEEVVQAGALWLRICCFGYPALFLLLLCRNALQSMGHYRILPFLGILESFVNTGMALFVSRYGYLFVCFAILLKWTLPGITAWIWYRRCIRKREQKWGVYRV